MAAWLTVYCTRSVSHLTASDLTAALTATDLHIFAEAFGIDDESIVDDALAQLKIESVSGLDGVRFQLTYAGSDTRPVLIHVWDDAARVRTERDEALEELHNQRLRNAVQQSVEVIGIELGWSQVDSIAIVLAVRIAEAFASSGSGFIRGLGDDWWTVVDGASSVVFGPNDDA